MNVPKLKRQIKCFSLKLIQFIILFNLLLVIPTTYASLVHDYVCECDNTDIASPACAKTTNYLIHDDEGITSDEAYKNCKKNICTDSTPCCKVKFGKKTWIVR